MKTPQDIRADIERLNVSHASGDGGYGLVHTLTAYASELTSSERTDLRVILLNCVASQHETLWAVALEVLVQNAVPETASQLAKVLDSMRGNAEVVDYVINALLRLRYKDIQYMPLIEEGLAKSRPMALPNLAALALVSPDESLTLAVASFERDLCAGNYSQVAANLPPFAYQYTAVDDELLLRLVDGIRALNPKAGRRLARMVSDLVSTPWFVRDIGMDRSAALRERLAASH
jgi:hypothetical protein